jgi:hypothetical protein
LYCRLYGVRKPGSKPTLLFSREGYGKFDTSLVNGVGGFV